MRRFGDLLRDSIEALGISDREFARRVGYSSGNLSQILAHKRRMPLERLPKWHKELKTSTPYSVFLELALLEASPEQIRLTYWKMKERLGG